MTLARRAPRDLPADLALPLERGEPWWYWLGGRPALDFVNTLRERWWRQVETLVTPEDLLDWLHLAEQPVPPASAASAALLGEASSSLEAARALREAIDAAVGALLADEPAPAAACAVIDRHLPAATSVPRLTVAADGTPQLIDAAAERTVAHALGLVAFDAAQLLGTEQRRRVRICAAADCSARFYDASRPGRRRWCSMEGCGNREKARRHRQTRGTPAQDAAAS